MLQIVRQIGDFSPKFYGILQILELQFREILSNVQFKYLEIILRNFDLKLRVEIAQRILHSIDQGSRGLVGLVDIPAEV